MLSDIDFKCQRKHPIILPETQLPKDGSGAGFKVGKVKLHFEVHGLAFSIISVLDINKHEPHSGYSVCMDLSAPENLH